MTNTPLSEAAIKDIVEGMPDGLNGFTKHWGWLQFARKIEAAHGITQQTTMPTPSTIKAGQRLLINLPSSGLTEIKVIEINGAFAKAEVSNEMRWERIERIQSSVVHVLEEPKPRQSMADAVRKANHADALQRLIQLGDLEMSPEGRALYEQDRDKAAKQSRSLRSMFATFGWKLFMEITSRVADGECDEWCEDAMEKAVAIGLAKKEPYNPAIHGDMEADAGDAIWTWHHLPSGWNKAVEFIDPSTGDPQPDLSKRGVLHLQLEYGPRHSTYIDGFLQSQDTCSFQFPLPISPFPKGQDTYTRSSHGPEPAYLSYTK